MAQEENRSTRSPSISVVIPTLNAQNTLGACLESISRQLYPGEMEIIIADGGSVDDTLRIASGYGCGVVDNPAKTGEAGKAAGVRQATGELVALVDSDNILPADDWLARMVAPFDDPAIAGTEPIRFEYRRADPPLTRYCALIGMNDPLCHFLKNYDRENVLSGRWTGLDIETSDRGDYLEVSLKPGSIPTMGANGFLVRRDLLEELEIGDYLFDIDVVYGLVMRGNNLFAKVKVGIVHIYGKGLGTFARKQLRRVRDFRYYGSLGVRRYPWTRHGKVDLVRFILYCITVVPLLLQTAKGCIRKPDTAWALHAPACITTLLVYTWGFIEGAIRPREQERARWSQ